MLGLVSFKAFLGKVECHRREASQKSYGIIRTYKARLPSSAHRFKAPATSMQVSEHQAGKEFQLTEISQFD